MNAEWVAWRNEIANYCNGNWANIACAVCNDERINTITKANVTCPECGKSDKLYIVDQTTFAAHCCSASCNAHYSDGIALIAELNNERVTDTLKRLEKELGLSSKPKSQVVKFQPRKPKPVRSEVNDKTPDAFVLKERELLLKTIKNANGTLATKYLLNRGIDCKRLPVAATNALSFHPALKYYAQIVENDVIVGEEKGEYPAMVAKVLNSENEIVGFHKTYLTTNGEKADVLKAKQLSKAAYKKAYSELGAFVPLCKPYRGRYGIAEGIETALAVVSMKRPCWSVISATGIKNFVIPNDCKVLDLYGDLDASGTGQSAIIKRYLDIRNSNSNIKVNLYLPPEKYWDVEKNPKGIDFLDVFLMEPNVLSPIITEDV